MAQVLSADSNLRPAFVIGSSVIIAIGSTIYRCGTYILSSSARMIKYQGMDAPTSAATDLVRPSDLVNHIPGSIELDVSCLLK